MQQSSLLCGADVVGDDDVKQEGSPDEGLVVMVPRLTHLPLNDLPWERYEELLRQIANDELLQAVKLYA